MQKDRTEQLGSIFISIYFTINYNFSPACRRAAFVHRQMFLFSFYCHWPSTSTYLKGLCLVLSVVAAQCHPPTVGIMRLDLMQSLMLIPIRRWLSGYSPLLTSI